MRLGLDDEPYKHTPQATVIGAVREQLTASGAGTSKADRVLISSHAKHRAVPYVPQGRTA